MKTLVKMIFGSQLYGTSSEESDTDYKGMFLPSRDECFLDKIPKSINNTTGGKGKNTADDVDEEMYSLQYFMHLAHKGEMIVLDMLHAPDDMIIETSDIWEELRKNRSMFYSKNMHGYLGYIRKQTAKYSVKGERLAAMKEALDYLRTFYNENRVTNFLLKAFGKISLRTNIVLKLNFLRKNAGECMSSQVNVFRNL